MSESTKEEKKYRHELVAVSLDTIEGRVHPIEGVRKLCWLSHRLGESENPVFMPIRAIDSDTDYFPLGEHRKLFDAVYLQRVDNEINEYLDQARGDIMTACSEIIKIFA